MKKSGKNLIVILVIIIIGLVTFIVVDKVINKKVETEQNEVNKVDNTVTDSNNNNVNSNEKSNQEKIVGQWEIKRILDLDTNTDRGYSQHFGYDIAQKYHFEFYNDGTYIMLLGERDEKGTYEVDDEKVNMHSDTGNQRILEITEDENKNLILIEYEKESNVKVYYTNAVEHSVETQNSTIANETIRKALKDKKWLEDNIYPEYYFENNDLKKYTEVYLAKIHSINGNPAYLIDVTESMAASHYVYVVTYNDGKVFVSENPATGEYSGVVADLNKNIIAIENDPTGITSVYKIENGEFVEFARADLNYEDNTLYYYVNDENVSYGRYQTYIEDCVGIETELTNDNIDKYVK